MQLGIQTKIKTSEPPGNWWSLRSYDTFTKKLEESSLENSKCKLKETNKQNSLSWK